MLLISYETQAVYFINRRSIDYSRIVNADEAVKGTRYYCPYCGCAVHRKRSIKGNYYFERYSSEKHTNIKCQIFL